MRSLISLIVLSSIAYLAVSQIAPGSTFSVTGCYSSSGLSSINACTSCNLGFVLTNMSSTCGSLCQTGCTICLSGTTCLAGGCTKANYAFNSNNQQCIDCTGTNTPSVGGAATGISTGCSTCAISSTSTATSNVVTCTACSPTYTLYSAACTLCSVATKQTNGVTGIPNCYLCSGASSNVATYGLSTPITGYTGILYVVCTQCAAGYILTGTYNGGTVFTVATAAATVYQSTPITQTNTCFFSTAVCYSIASPQATIASGTMATGVSVDTTYGNQMIGQIGASTTMVIAAAGTTYTTVTNCNNGFLAAYLSTAAATGGSVGTYTVSYVMVCTNGTSGYYAVLFSNTPLATSGITANALMPLQTAGTIASGSVLATATNVLSSTTCNAGYYMVTAGSASTTSTTTVGVAAATSSVCTICSSGTLVSGVCYTVTNCAVALSSTTCSVPNSGYGLASGIPTACTTSTTSCAGGCPAGTILVQNGSCQTGTVMSGCLYYNATGFCVQCGVATPNSATVYTGYQTLVPNCTACSAGCSICSSASNCTNCSTGYTLTSTFTCASSANSTSKSSNMLLSGLAFISMIFYYIF